MYNYKWYDIQQSLDKREGYIPGNAASYGVRGVVAGVSIQQSIIKFFGASRNTQRMRNNTFKNELDMHY